MSVDKRESRVVVTQRQVTQVVSSGTQGPQGGQWANWDEIPDKPSTYPPSAHNHDTSYDPLGAAASAQAAAIAAAALDASTKASAAQSAAILAAAADATTKASAAQAASVAAAALDATGKIDALKDGVASDGDTLAKLRGLIQGIQTMLTSDNASLDTLQEVVDFVELHQSDLQALGAGKVNVSDIINALTDTSSNKPLSAAQGKVLKDALDALSAVVAGKQPAGNYVVESDARLSDAREWSAATVDQAEAESGTSTTRRAWTAQRVWQAASTAIAEWWSGTTSVFGRALVAVADAAAGRAALGLGTIATQNAASVEVGTLSASGQIYSAANIAAVGEVTGLTIRASTANLITDWNAAVTAGDFMAFEGANAPTPYGWYIGRATAHNTGYVTQEAWLFTADKPVRFRRHSRDAVWSAWVHTGEWSSSGLTVTGVVTAKGATAIDVNTAFESNASASGLTAYHAQNNGGYGAFFGYDNIRYSGGAAMVRNIANTPLVFEVNNAECGRFVPGAGLSVTGGLTTTGNVGIGVAPNLWSPFVRSIDISSGALAASGTTTQLSHNSYWDNVFKYKGNGFAAEYRLNNADGSHIWLTAGNNTSGANAPLAWTSVMTLDAAGNLGLGVTPSAWAGFKAHQIIGGAIASGTGLYNNLLVASNAYYNDSGYTYIGNEPATLYRQLTGAHAWYSAPSGNAGDPISFAQDMTLQNGHLGLGVVPSAWSSQNKAFDIGIGGVSSDSSTLRFASNAYSDFPGAFKYKANSSSFVYLQSNAIGHAWFSAPAGNAGDPISFTQAMTLDNNGNLLVGTTSGNCHCILKGLDTGDIQLTVGQLGPVSGAVFHFGNNSTVPNAASSLLKLGLMNVTGRSINAAGTINASGADYAEYERNNGLKISRGSVVGFKADGTLTLTYAEAIRFGIKSTNPSYVGGDVWGSEDQVGKRPDQPSYTAPTYTGPQAPVEPVKPAITEGEEVNTEADDAAYLEALNAYQEQLTAYFDAQAAHKAAVETAEAAHAEAMAQYEINKAAFDERLEAARQTVDRIAYSGKVPVNVLDATPGGYIIAAEGDAGEIVGEFVADPDFAQYKKAVGRVNRILEDGRCEVAVIVH